MDKHTEKLLQLMDEDDPWGTFEYEQPQMRRSPGPTMARRTTAVVILVAMIIGNIAAALLSSSEISFISAGMIILNLFMFWLALVAFQAIPMEEPYN